MGHPGSPRYKYLLTAFKPLRVYVYMKFVSEIFPEYCEKTQEQYPSMRGLGHCIIFIRKRLVVMYGGKNSEIHHSVFMKKPDAFKKEAIYWSYVFLSKMINCRSVRGKNIRSTLECHFVARSWGYIRIASDLFIFFHLIFRPCHQRPSPMPNTYFIHSIPPIRHFM